MPLFVILSQSLELNESITAIQGFQKLPNPSGRGVR